ncbi:hypothetical protein F2Q70_00018704 [Brassica cretica]|uniref:Hydroxyproline O-arabinosyltransferase-like domain-containing protein n=1 Tax=Brassica cretica TaxID=69181 RepID=A0A8S9I1T6_BRACR|nr:hypothetical protein F2Q70_00018704 [Brassica cretica]
MNMDTSNKNGFSIFHGFLMMFLSLQLQEVCSDRIFTNQSLSGYQTIVSSGYVYELDLFTPEPEDWVASLLRDNDYVAMGDGLTSTSTKLWQSFDVPQCLISWNSIKDPSPGHYSLKVDHKTRNTLIVMVSNGSKSCWSSGPCYVSDQRCMVYSYGGSFRLCNGKTSQVSCECIPNFARDRNFPLQNIQIKSERSQYFVSMSMSWSFEGMNNQSQMRLENKGATKHYKTATIVLASVLTSVAAAAFLVGSCCCYFSSRRRTRAQKAEADTTETEDGDGEGMCDLSLHTIIRATNGFSEDCKIGEGGFGPVYKPPWDTEVGDKYIIHYTYGCDYDMKGKLTYGKVGEWRFDKRSYDSTPPPRNLTMPPPGVSQSVVTLVKMVNEATANIPNWGEQRL